MAEQRTQVPSDPPPDYDDDDKIAEKSVKATPKPLPRGPFPLDIPVLRELRGKRVVLASASPRRKEILNRIGFHNLEIRPSTLPESFSKTALSPLEYVLQTASQKAIHIYQQSLATASSPPSLKDPSLVIAADTVVVTTSGVILEKPRSEAHHISMLKMLRDQGSHKVFTAVVVMAPREDARAPGYGIKTFVEETKVVFDQSLSDEFLEAYVRTREAAGMAGGYGIQGMGSLLVERVEGSWDNVVGLPGRVLLRLVEELLGDVSREGDEGSEDEEE